MVATIKAMFIAVVMNTSPEARAISTVVVELATVKLELAFTYSYKKINIVYVISHDLGIVGKRLICKLQLGD